MTLCTSGCARNRNRMVIKVRIEKLIPTTKGHENLYASYEQVSSDKCELTSSVVAKHMLRIRFVQIRHQEKEAEDLLAVNSSSARSEEVCTRWKGPFR